MSDLEYSIVIQRLPEHEGGGFVAIVPDLAGCISDGATSEEALHNVYDAMACWIEEAQELGRPIPRPTRHRAYA